MTEAQLEHFRLEHEKLEKKYQHLLKFVRWCKETASCHACDYQSMLAGKVLKEIGEIK